MDTDKALIMAGRTGLTAEVTPDPKEQGKFHAKVTYAGKMVEASAYGRNSVLEELGRQLNRLVAQEAARAKELEKLASWNKVMR